MKNNIFKKGIVFGIILLFIGMSFSSIITAKSILKKTTKSAQPENESGFFGKIIGHVECSDLGGHGGSYSGTLQFYLFPFFFRSIVWFFSLLLFSPLSIIPPVYAALAIILTAMILVIYIVESDNNGNFEINNVRPGTYFIGVDNDDVLRINPISFFVGKGETVDLEIGLLIKS